VSGGLLVELAQSLVSRETEILDALANALGAGLALGLWALVMRASPERS
jgi:VanZ family protein